jgi:hypothetical protein
MDTNSAADRNSLSLTLPQPIVFAPAETKQVARLSLYDPHDDRHRPPTDPVLGMSWTPALQTFYHGTDIFTHEGPTNTEPSHDLAHLFVAAGSNLPWKPIGDDRLGRLAEYNAIFIEHMLDRVYTCVILRSIKPDIILTMVLQYARWFVETHYAPFPVPAEEAYRLFCWGIDGATIVRLSPYFFIQKKAERDDPSVRTRSTQISFAASDVPPAEGNSLAFKTIVTDLMGHITRGFSR